MPDLLQEAFTYSARNVSKKVMELVSSREELQERISSAAVHGLPLYAHIPYCKSLCPFCSFNRYPFNNSDTKLYYAQLTKELEMYAERGYNFNALHIGGGTPTVLMDELALFIDRARALFNIRYIDVESTPNEINESSIEILRSAKVRRLSIGVQSFDDSLLKDMGRSGYKGIDALEKIDMAKGRFSTVGIDLLFNLPTQTEASFSKDIALFKASGIDQATFYPLMPGPHKHTLIERSFREYAASRPKRRERRFYDIIKERLLGKGYFPSSAWCFNKRERSADEYIINNAEYVGIGSGSISIVNNVLYMNSFSLGKYAAMISEGRMPIIRYMGLSRREYLIYELLMSLFSLHIHAEQLSGGRSRPIAKELALLRVLNMIKSEEYGFRVTTKGMYYVSLLMSEFFSSLNTLRELCIERQL